ncbi:OsmC family protein [bacterium]|nr:OsmC family protein [bacterium]
METEDRAAQIDGIDLDNLKATVTMFRDHPDLARFKFRARNVWKMGTHNQTQIERFYGAGQEDTSRPEPIAIEADEPPLLLGHNAGANPVEHVLVALSSCLTTSLVANAAARGIRLRAVTSKLEGDLDVRGFLGLSDEVRNGYQNIRVSFEIDADAPEETLRELVEIAKQRSPVFDIVSHGVPVEVGLASSP